MSTTASQTTSLTIVYWTVYSGVDKRKHQSSASLAFVRGIHRWPVNSPHKGPVTQKVLPFDDVIIYSWYSSDAAEPSMRNFIGYIRIPGATLVENRPSRACSKGACAYRCIDTPGCVAFNFQRYGNTCSCAVINENNDLSAPPSIGEGEKWELWRIKYQWTPNIEGGEEWGLWRFKHSVMFWTRFTVSKPFQNNNYLLSALWWLLSMDFNCSNTFHDKVNNCYSCFPKCDNINDTV